MLELENLSCRFNGRLAVDGVTLTIPKGQMVGVIGRSGAGKSTLLRMINRLAEPSEGAIRWEGRSVSGLQGRALRDWRTECAMVFQQFNLVQRLDVLANVLVGTLNRRRGALGPFSGLFPRFTAAERAAALAVLDRFDLAPTALQRAETLSGGQQQRVAICRALLQRPQLLLADEPIASLDPQNAALVMQSLARVNREEHLTVLVNLHHIEIAKEYCQRIIALRAGKLVFDGRPEDLGPQRMHQIYGSPAEAADAAALIPALHASPAEPALPSSPLAHAPVLNPANTPAHAPA